MRFFTYQWTQSQIALEREAATPRNPFALTNIAGGRLRRCGVGRGDRVFIVGNAGGQLQLLGAIDVDRIVAIPKSLRWTNGEHESTHNFEGMSRSASLHRFATSDFTFALRFEPGNRPPARDAKGCLDRQTFRGVRELTAASAAKIAVFLRAPIEESTPRTYREGTPRRVTLTRFDRDPRARIEAIAWHGTKCFSCSLTFETRYGVRGNSLVHVHHCNDLADGVRITHPRQDLVVLCPNCHVVVHELGTTPEALRRRLRRKSGAFP